MSRKNRTKRKRAPHTAAQNSTNGNRPSKCFECFSGTLKIVVLPFFVSIPSIPSIREQGDGPGYGRRQKKTGGLEGVIGGVIGPSYVHTIEGHGVLWE